MLYYLILFKQISKFIARLKWITQMNYSLLYGTKCRVISYIIQSYKSTIPVPYRLLRRKSLNNFLRSYIVTILLLNYSYHSSTGIHQK